MLVGLARAAGWLRPRRRLLPAATLLLLCAVGLGSTGVARAGSADKYAPMPGEARIALGAQLVIDSHFTPSRDSSAGSGDCAVVMYLDVALQPGAKRSVGGYTDNGQVLDGPVGEGSSGMPAYIPQSKGHFYSAIAGRYSSAGGEKGCPGEAAGELTSRFKGAFAYAYFDRGKEPSPSKKPKKPDDHFLLAGHIKDDLGKPLVGVAVSIGGGEAAATVVTDASGLYSKLLPQGVYVVRAARSDLRPVRSADCTLVHENDTSCTVRLSQDRTADFEVAAPILVIKAELGPYVHGTTYHDAVRAGYAFKVDVVFRNTSRTRRIALDPQDLYLRLSGNAVGGWLQPRSAPVYPAGGANGAADEVRLSPALLLQPKESRELSFVVRTQTTSVDWVEPVDRSGKDVMTTVPATARLIAPKVAVLPKGGAVSDISPEDIEWRPAAKAVKLEGDRCTATTCSFTLPVDDSVEQPPPWNTGAFLTELAVGVPPAIASFTWGTIRGLLWDLPNTAAAWAFGAIYHQARLLELVDAVMNGPQRTDLWPRYVAAVATRILAEYAEAPFLQLKKGAELLGSVDELLRKHWQEVARQYYSGDWHAAARTMAGEGTEGLLSIVTLPSSGTLFRLAGARAAALAEQATWAKQLAEKVRQLKSISRAEIVAAEASDPVQEVRLLGELEQAGAALTRAPDGAAIAAADVESTVGFSAEEVAKLRPVLDGELTGGRRIVAVFQGRSGIAARLEGLLGKPSWMKPKAITLDDVKYLGESAADLGTEVWTEPPFLALAEKGQLAEAERRFLTTLKQGFARRGLPPLRAEELAAASKQWRLRIGEWTSAAPDQVSALVARARAAARTGGRTSVEFVNEGNYSDPSVKNLRYEVDYRLDSSITSPADDLFGARRRFIPSASRKAGGSITRIRSDNDPKYFCYENGRPLSDGDKAKVFERLWEDGIIEHPDIGSYADAGLRAKLLEDGASYFGIGPDGIWRKVVYNLKSSLYRTPGDNRQVFFGLPLVPNLP